MDTGSIASWDTRRVSIGAVIKEQSVRWPGVSISECITDMSAVLSSLPYPPTQNSYHNYFLGYNDNDEVSHKNSCTFLLCGITVRLQSRNQCCLRWRVAKLKVSITYSADFGNAMLNYLKWIISTQHYSVCRFVLLASRLFGLSCASELSCFTTCVCPFAAKACFLW